MNLPPVGSIGLVKMEGLAGGLIRVGEWLDGDGFRDYEHAFVLASSAGLGTAEVIEAEPGGVRRVKLAEYIGRRVLWIPCPEQYQVGMVDAAGTYLHVPYSFADYFAVAERRLASFLSIRAFHRKPGARRPVLPVQELVKLSHHVMCSQLAAACAQKAGWPLLHPDEWAGYITPDDLARIALSLAANSLPRLIE